MLGIPYRVMRQSSDEGPVDKTLFLATRRSGEAGDAMREAMREYRRHQMAMAKASQSYRTAEARIAKLGGDDERVERLIEQRDGQFERLLESEQAALKAAENLVRLSLTENYGRANALAAMDQLCDDDLHEMVVTIQTGEQPEDFFLSRARREKASSFSPPDGSPSGSFSSTDSPAESSSAERSGLTKPAS